NRPYPSVTTPITAEDYSAILIGEVSGNWNNTGARPVDSKRSVNNSDAVSRSGPARAIVVDLPNVAMPVGKEVIAPVNVQGVADKDVISYEFDLRYDPSVIQPQADPV